MSLRFPFSPNKIPPIPAVIATIQTTDGQQTSPPLSALLDTAADRTVIPHRMIALLGLKPVRTVQAQGFGSAPFVVEVHQVFLLLFRVYCR